MSLLLRFTLIIFIGFPLLSNAQSYWKTYRTEDGLVDSVITDLSVGEDKVYIATPSGFSVFENETFTNFDTTNSPLVSQNIRRVRNFKDTVWMITDSGLSRYLNGVITNYTVDSGLVSNEINDIEFDSKGVLWIGSKDGLSRRVGSTFINDLTKEVYELGINGGDTVYASANRTVINAPFPPTTTEMFDGTNWNPVHDPNFPVILDPKFISLSDGTVGISSIRDGGFLISDQFTLESFTPTLREKEFVKIDYLEKDSRGNLWLVGSLINGIQLNEGGIHKWDGQNYTHYLIGLPDRVVNVIKTSIADKKMYIGTNNGFAVADDSIKAMTFEYEIHTSSIQTRINADGRLGINFFSIGRGGADITNDFEFPKGSRTHTLFDSQLWITAKNRSGENLLARHDFNRGDFLEGPVNNKNIPTSSTMVKINRQEIRDHLLNYQNPGYIMPDAIRNWPATGNLDAGEEEDMAPFVDVSGSNCYDPENGDYPFILGDTAFYYILNDGRTRLQGTHAKLNIEVHCMIYVFDIPEVEHIDNSIFMRYTFVNRSDETYRDLGISFAFDTDIGSAIDDFTGCEPASNIYYAYNGDNNDETASGLRGYGTIIPAFGVKFISEDLGGFMGFGNGLSGTTSRPFREQDFIRSFKGQWNNGSPITIGGDGFNASQNDSTEFLFPGDVKNLTEWSELNPGPDYPRNNPGDRMISGRTASINLKAGERKIVDLAIGVGLDSNNTDYLDNVHLLIDNLNKAGKFQLGVDSLAPSFQYSTCLTSLDELKGKQEAIKHLLIYPNPTNGNLNLLANENIVTATVFDLSGRQMQEIQFSQALRLQSFQISNELSNGMYFVQIHTQDGNIYAERVLIRQ